jgi:CheY-like chemotaxis protein
MKKIIVVDDSPTFLMHTGLLLKRLNFKVIPAENGVEFFRFLKFGRPDAVLLDVEMR